MIIISSIILIFVFSFSYDLNTYARKEIDQKNFSIALLRNDYAESRKILYRLIPNFDKRESQDLVITLLNIVEASSKDMDDAISDFGKLNQSLLRKLAKRSQNLAKLNLLSKYIKDREAKLEELSLRLPDVEKNNAIKINLQISNLQFVLDELNNYFSLPESQITADAKGNYVFSKGLLKGLPIITRLPDGLKDLPEFQEALDKVGGKVRYGNGDIYKEFKAKINELRTACNGYVKTINGLKSETRKIEKEIKALKDPDLTNLKLWQTRIRMLFLDIVDI